MADKLIPLDEMSVLKSASEVKDVAESAIDIQNEMTAAYIINNAANTGQRIAVWGNHMTDTLKSTLEGKGYTVTRNDRGAAERWDITF